MNPNEIIDKILGHRVKVKLLRHFVLDATAQKTGRELAHLAKVSPPTLLTHLQELILEGLVTKTVIGASHTFRLNRDNIFVRDYLVPLFEAESKNIVLQFGNLLTGSLPTKGIESVLLYGSIARGESNSQSDWDVLFLCSSLSDKETIQKALDEALPALRAQFSSTIDIKIFLVDEFCRRYIEGDRFASAIYDDVLSSRVPNPLMGKSLTEILNAYVQKDKNQKH